MTYPIYQPTTTKIKNE